MNKRKISIIISLLTIISMGASFTPTIKINTTRNEVLLSNSSKNTNENLCGITKNNITLLGNWSNGNYKTDIISFNPISKKINIGGSMKAYFGNFSGSAFKISLYSKHGKLIKTETYSAGQMAQSLYNDFNNLDFNYGDILNVDILGPVKTKVSNFNGELNYETSSNLSVEITQKGLINLKNNTADISALYNGENTILSGKIQPNTSIYANANNVDYTAKSNAMGEFNITIPKDVVAGSQITVLEDGYEPKVIKSIPNPNIYGIVNNNITLLGNWNNGNYKTDIISFNPISKKINIGGSMPAYFGNFSGNAFKISLYSKHGKLIKTEIYSAGQMAQSLYNDFNNLDFNYGDIINIDILGPVKTQISNFNNESRYTTSKTIQLEVTQKGLELSNMKNVEVNPFGVLGDGPSKSGVITGNIGKANQAVYATVDGKTFVGTSDANGNYKIDVSSLSVFTVKTNITVDTDGYLTTKIAPVSISNLGLNKCNITINDSQGGTAQNVSFNTATMTVQNPITWENAFSMQLIDGKSGQVLASSTTSNFNVFASKNKLQGASFEYGDIIEFYESQETELSLGNPILNNGKNQTSIPCTRRIVSYEITPNGLVKVQNKNLETSQVLYEGSSNLMLTGTTLPNTDVKIYYGNKYNTVKSDNEGKFSMQIPFSEAGIGSEVRVYVNSENNKAMLVNYDSQKFTLNKNKVEILNNTNVPIFDITFNPSNNKLSAVEFKYPLDKEYTGTFYGNELNINIINSKTGKTIYSANGNKLNDINSFISALNNKSYTTGDIIEISYNSKYVSANVYNNNKIIGNTNGTKEYFEITNKGLINLDNKFININPLDILTGQKVTNTNIIGKVAANTKVQVSVEGKIFDGKSNENGEFNIPITDENGFTKDTNILVSAKDYIPTIVNPTLGNNVNLNNSYINFYNSKGFYGNLSSNITFNPETMKFVVNNYTDSFGDGKSYYFNFDLYDNNGNEILNTSINNGNTSELTNALNNKSFKYGDIIGLTYNSKISKPVIMNGDDVIGNINGKTEYFKITKTGLVSVEFGQKASTSNVYWDGSNLVIDSVLANGQKSSILNDSKKLVILNSENKIVDSVNTTQFNDNKESVQAIIPEAMLNKSILDGSYKFVLEIGNELFPIQVNSNLAFNTSYLLNANSDNQLVINKVKPALVIIKTANEITNYKNSFDSNINKYLNNNTATNAFNNSSMNYEITTVAFINRIGEQNLESIFDKSEENKEFINWLLNNQTAMSEYLNATNQDNINLNSIEIWSNIWNRYTNSRSGFNLKLAIAVAISNATPIYAWPEIGTVGSPVQRYNIFEGLNASGGMLPIFQTLNVRYLEYVVGTSISNDDIMKARSVILQNHNAFINSGQSGLNNIAYTIAYNLANPHTGVSVFANGFYGPNPKITDVWYDGGVCGATSKIGSIGCNVFGLPAVPVGQPGHCAFIYDNASGDWSLGNNVDGWSLSNGGELSGWSKGIATNENAVNYDLLYEKANTQALQESNKYLWIANISKSYDQKINAINEAIKTQPLNLGAWLDKINLMKSDSDTTFNQYNELVSGIIATFKNYPMPMFDTILQTKDEILSKGTQQQYDEFVQNIENALNSVTDTNQTATASDMLKLMSQFNLVKGAVPLGNSLLNVDNIYGTYMGSISFDTSNMKLKVGEGAGLMDPNTSNELFSISLEKANGEVVKSLSSYGKSYLELALLTAFNNVSFEYGDKIVIDYKQSSKITVNNLVKGGNKAMNINKKTTLEITKQGLIPVVNN